MFFNNVGGPRTPTLLKRDSNTDIFQRAKFLRTPCFTNYLQRLLLPVKVFQLSNLLKTRLRQRCFFLWVLENFWEHLLTEHLRMTGSCVYLRILRSCSEHLCYRAPYFMYKLQNLRSSRQEVFCENGVLRNFTKFTGKHLCQSHFCLFFNKVADLWPATLFKKRFWRRYFLMNFVKSLRTLSLT